MTDSAVGEEPEAHKRGVRLEQNDQLDEALEAFSELECGNVYSQLAAHLSKGRVLWKMLKFEEASESFKRASGLKPDSKIASLGRYHTLMDAGSFDEALEEAKRYFQDRWGTPDSDPNVEKYRTDTLALIGMGEENLKKCREQIVKRAQELRESGSN